MNNSDSIEKGDVFPVKVKRKKHYNPPPYVEPISEELLERAIGIRVENDSFLSPIDKYRIQSTEH